MISKRSALYIGSASAHARCAMCTRNADPSLCVALRHRPGRLMDLPRGSRGPSHPTKKKPKVLNPAGFLRAYVASPTRCQPYTCRQTAPPCRLEVPRRTQGAQCALGTPSPHSLSHSATSPAVPCAAQCALQRRFNLSHSNNSFLSQTSMNNKTVASYLGNKGLLSNHTSL